MDPVTHFLTGACMGRAGLNRRTAYATLAATLAAEAPDIDVVTSLGGPVTGFAHHRGITHTLIGAPFMALAITVIVYAWHRLRRPSSATRSPGHPPAPPVSWPWVWTVALLADFSHLLLDYTNNYGLRPFYPFNPHWYSLDLVFIIEPLLLVALFLALILPAIFGLVESEMRRQQPLFRGRGLAIAALTFMVLLWALRNAEHAHALALARTGTAESGPLTRAPLLRLAALPYPVDPFHWHVIGETANAYQQADVHTLSDSVTRSEDAVQKSPVTPAVAAAKRSHLGRVYLDWSSWPLTTDLGALPIPGAPTPQAGWHTVQFSDLRFNYFQLGGGDGQGTATPLAAWAYVTPSGSVELEAMNGRIQP